MTNQIEVSPGIFGTDSENYSRRVPCVVVLDCSTSMAGSPIATLNDALKRFEIAVKSDERAKRTARIMLIRAGGDSGNPDRATVLVPFQDAETFSAPTVSAAGNTPLGEAVLLALDMIENEKLNLSKLNHHRPWLFVMSDGAPTDKNAWEDACRRSIAAIQAKKVSVFAIAIDGGNAAELQKLTPRSVEKMDSAKFEEYFLWLSNSMAAAGGSGEANPPMASGRDDWASA